MPKLYPPVIPRNGSMAKVLVPCRVSDPGPGKQDVRSLVDQLRKVKAYLDETLDCPYEMIPIEGCGSGEIISREDHRRLVELVESGEYDLVVTEDLGRIMRRVHAHLFAELCGDVNTRLIAINDHVDTGVPGWQDQSMFAVWHHERSNRDSSERVKRTLLSRFQDGGCAQFAIFGIVKPLGSKNDSQWHKDPDCEPIYAEIWKMLWEHGNFSAVADWLNEQGVSTGPMCKRKKWHGAMVRRLIFHPLLRGWRFRNKHKSKRSSDGRYKAVKAEVGETKWRHVPHLAFFKEEDHLALLAKLEAQHRQYSIRKDRGIPPSTRRRTRFPGQLTFCGICGRPYVFGAHGETDALMCDGAREYKCWNGTAFKAPLASRRIIAAIVEELESLPEFDDTFLQIINEESGRIDKKRLCMMAKLDQSIRKLEQEIERLLELTEAGAKTASIIDRIMSKESALAACKYERTNLSQRPSTKIEIPSVHELRSLAHAEIHQFDTSSWKFQGLMAKIVPRIVVFPLQIIDGGRPFCRASFRLRIGNLLPDRAAQEVLVQPLERIITVDLFEPPQRTAHLNQILSMRRGGLTEKMVAKSLGITVTAAQRAATLGREMERVGLAEPYRYLTSPEGVTKLTRHFHDRYRFDPLPGAGTI